MKFIDKMLLTNDCGLSRISSETRNYVMHKSMCRATPGDLTAIFKVRLWLNSPVNNFKSGLDGNTASWLLICTSGGLRCLAQGHYHE